jgi:hypothetical protein
LYQWLGPFPAWKSNCCLCQLYSREVRIQFVKEDGDFWLVQVNSTGRTVEYHLRQGSYFPS